nr:hypothetical protein pPsy0479b_00043 [Pseudomonas syringae]
MIQCPAAGALDLEFGVATHAKGAASCTARIYSLSTLALVSFCFAQRKTPPGRGLGNRNLPVGSVEKPVSGGCPEAQIAYRGAFLPPSGKAGKGQFRGGSSLAGVQHQFDHSCAIGPDKRYV